MQHIWSAVRVANGAAQTRTEQTRKKTTVLFVPFFCLRIPDYLTFVLEYLFLFGGAMVQCANVRFYIVYVVYVWMVYSNAMSRLLDVKTLGCMLDSGMWRR